MIRDTKLRAACLITCLAGAALSLQGCAGWSSWENGKKKDVGPVVPERMPGPREYVVQRGDTVFGIAFRNNVDYRDVARWNDIGPDFLIHPGQVLRLRAPKQAADAPPKPQTRFQTDQMQSRAIEDAGVAAPQAVTADSPPPAIAPPPPPKPGDDDVKPGSYAWGWPVERAPVIRGFGQQGSKGVDFTGVEGQPVFAAAPGRVVYSGNALKGYGELIIIKHDDVYLSAYGYNRKRYVKEGDVVTTGQPIAEMGLGPENKPLLHFEIREKGAPISPALKLPARLSAAK
ncbi:peptidoglycan DD-metalloendopeptidase family protein [Solimonas soli]|uniref:peptidoglycan DD-metalloendopeptidase family protein n=1 Tax=Solimonas soli TaxID=413479 RepID=UPI0004B7FE76|nr:peptidoglycan DD-metalloendopeptidase family protein [Solimonas soli]